MDETKQTVGEKIEETVKAAEETVRHPLTKKLARFGFYTKGGLFIVIGILAVMVAVGREGGELTGASGALAAVSRAPFGKVILIIFIAGAIGHGVWNILRGVADVDDAGKDWKGVIKRGVAVGIGIFYLFLAWTAWSTIVTAQTVADDGAIQKTLTAFLLALPFGTILVVVIGLIVMGAGVHECYSGLTGKFQENFRLYELQGNDGAVITILGYFSFAARAVIFALIGYFFIWAAINYDPNIAVGLDGALMTLAQTYYGKTLLFVTAAGLICHGILSLYEAKYRRIC